MSKEKKRIAKAFANLGFRSEEILTLSDLKMEISENKESVIKCDELIETAKELKEKALQNIALYEDVENEYEKEILRELNPKLTIK